MDLKQIATQYFETFSRKDLPGLAELFTDDVSLRDWERTASGKEAMLLANKDIFDNVDSLSVTPTALYQDGNTVSAEIEILVNNETTLLVVDILTFVDGKISSVRAYKGY